MRYSSIHGRFQPFHNGHLAYLRKALLKNSHMYIGITRPFGHLQLGKSDNIRDGRHSQASQANPFSFFQRKILISQALESVGIPSDQYSIIPFPLENSELLNGFFPTTGICYTTIKDQWNIDKISLLRSLGYNVEVLEVENSGDYLSGSEIRKLAALGDKSWVKNVPTGVAAILAGWDGKPVEENYGFEDKLTEETTR